MHLAPICFVGFFALFFLFVTICFLAFCGMLVKVVLQRSCAEIAIQDMFLTSFQIKAERKRETKKLPRAADEAKRDSAKSLQSEVQRCFDSGRRVE